MLFNIIDSSGYNGQQFVNPISAYDLINAKVSFETHDNKIGSGEIREVHLFATPDIAAAYAEENDMDVSHVPRRYQMSYTLICELDEETQKHTLNSTIELFEDDNITLYIGE